jgi:hypothetical protein
VVLLVVFDYLSWHVTQALGQSLRTRLIAGLSCKRPMGPSDYSPWCATLALGQSLRTSPIDDLRCKRPSGPGNYSHSLQPQLLVNLCTPGLLLAFAVNGLLVLAIS